MAEIFETVVGSGTSMDDNNNNNNSRTLSPEPLEGHETFLPRYEEQLIPGTKRNKDSSSNNNDNMMPEVVEEVAEALTAGFQSSNASHILEMQGGNNEHVSIDMPPHQLVPARLPPPAPVQLIRAIWTISFFTLVPAIRAALYKPARGVVFSHNKIAYYLALSAIFTSGLGEAATAFWLSHPGGASRHRLSFGRAVLCASILPFVAVLGISRYGFIEG